MPRKRAAPLTANEKKERQREYQRRYLAKKAAREGKAPPKQKSLFPPSEQNELSIRGDDPAITAAQINERYHFSVIIGQFKRGRKTVIAERIGGKAAPDIEKRYRLKTTVYEYFSSEGELQRYCLRNKIPLETSRRKE